HQAAATPVVVYALEVPEGFPEGVTIDVPCRLLGVPFKRWAYLAADGSSLAPVVLAKRLAAAPAAPSQAAELPSRRISLPLLLAGGFALAAIALAWIAYDWRRSQRSGRHLPAAIPPGYLAQLAAPAP